MYSEHFSNLEGMPRPSQIAKEQQVNDYSDSINPPNRKYSLTASVPEGFSRKAADPVVQSPLPS